MRNKNIRDWVGGRESIDKGSIKCEVHFRKSGFVSESEDQGKKQITRDWVGVPEETIVENRRSGSKMFENRIPGTGWVVGSDQLVRKFDQPGLVGAIEKSGSNMDSIKPGIEWVFASE